MNGLRYHGVGAPPARLLLSRCSLLAAAQPQPLLAQYQKYEGMTVTNIQFDPPDQPLEAAELHDILPLKMGQPLRMADVRASIERLFATGRYADIQVDARALSRRRGAHVRHEEQLVHRHRLGSAANCPARRTPGSSRTPATSTWANPIPTRS